MVLEGECRMKLGFCEMGKMRKTETELGFCRAGLFAVSNCEQQIRQICCSQLLTANNYFALFAVRSY